MHCPVSLNGTTYSKYLGLGGGGNTSYRSVAFEVSGPCTIKVVAKSSGSSTRTLAVCGDSGNRLTTLSCSSSIGAKTYSYTGNAGTIYIYSTNSGINIYGITVE